MQLFFSALILNFMSVIPARWKRQERPYSESISSLSSSLSSWCRYVVVLKVHNCGDNGREGKIFARQRRIKGLKDACTEIWHSRYFFSLSLFHHSAMRVTLHRASSLSRGRSHLSSSYFSFTPSFSSSLFRSFSPLSFSSSFSCIFFPPYYFPDVIHEASFISLWDRFPRIALARGSHRR